MYRSSEHCGRYLLATMIRVESARTYSLIGILLTVLVGAIISVVALATAPPLQTPLFALGVLALMLSLVAFMTTAERMRRDTLIEGLAARGPCLLFGIIMLAYGALFAVFFINILMNMTLAVAFMSFAAAIFFILAHANIQVERPPISSSQAPQPQPQPVVVGETPIEEPGTMDITLPSSRTKALAYLDCKQGQDMGRSFSVRSYSLTIGRRDPGKWRPTADDVVLTDKSISRPHAQLQMEDSGFFITDLNSANGTYVDGTPVPPKQRYPISDGAQIRLGPRVILNFRVSGSGAETEI
jgi:hypothetical protein